MKTIEIVCEVCQASERVGEGFGVGRTGRTGQLHCRACGNQIEFEAHEGDWRVSSGGLLLELEGSPSPVATPRATLSTARDEGSRDSLTPHTFAQTDELPIRLPAPPIRALLSARTQPQEGSLPAQVAAPTVRASLPTPAYPLPPSRRQSVAVPNRENGSRPGGARGRGSGSHAPASTTSMGARGLSSRTPWGLMTAAISLGMVVGLAIGVVGRTELAEARFADVPPVEQTDEFRPAWSTPAQPARVDKGRVEPARVDAGVDAVLLGVEPGVDAVELGEFDQETEVVRPDARHDAQKTALRGAARPAEVSVLAKPVEVTGAAPVGTSVEAMGSDVAAAPMEGAGRALVVPGDVPAVAPTSPSDGMPLGLDALSGILNGAAAQASATCREPGDPGGTAQVTITFANSGKVTRALVSGQPFAGTVTGSCIARSFRALRVDPFAGERVTVKKTVTIH